MFIYTLSTILLFRTNPIEVGRKRYIFKKYNENKLEARKKWIPNIGF